MKANRFIIAAVAIAAAVACSKEGPAGSEYTRETESVTIISGIETKTSLNGKEVCWSSDDEIAVFDNSNYKNLFTITQSEGSYATFSGRVTAGTTQIYAVYPHDLAVSASGSTLKVKIPADQTSKAGSFAEEHNISVAKGIKTPGREAIGDVTFKNVCALLKFTIPSYISDATSVTLSSNSVIAGELTVDYSGETPTSAISTEGSRSITMTGSYPAGSTFIFVLAPGMLDGFTVTVESEKGTWAISRDTQVELTAGNYKNLGTLELEQANAVSASAAHVYSGNTLTGTDVSVSLDIPATTAKYITALNLQVKNSAGTVVRTLSKATAAATETIAASADWPYLPQGTYTISGTYTLSGNTTKEIAAVTFESPAPTFSVTSGAYSSYTKYISGQSSVANTLAADQIYDINKASVSISSDILNNGNYSGIIGGFTYKLDGTATTAAYVSGQSWGGHTVTATYTFDGVGKSGSSDCHITGLPYTAAPPTNSGTHPWVHTEGGVKWNTSNVDLEGTSDKGHIITSPAFAIPSNISVKMDVSTQLYSYARLSIWALPKLRCSIGGTEVISRDGSKGTTNWIGSGDKTEDYTGSGAGTLTSANNTVEIKNAYTMETAHVYVHSVQLSYN